MMDLVYAAGQAPGGESAGSGFSALLPLLLMFVVFYFLLIRPQQRKQREHRQMLTALKTGDRVVTAGGLYGTIVSLDEEKIKLKIAENVKVDVARGSVASKVGWGEGKRANGQG
ncbi:MAG: preprotein translocase subunit YajC [Candidatus Methylomirabilales bacterium]